MITSCRTCRAALDEDKDTCPDCGTPNPHYQNPDANMFVQFARLQHLNFLETQELQWPLLATAVVVVLFGLSSGFGGLFVAPWSRLSPLRRITDIAGLALLASDVGLAFLADFERRVWRVVARTVIGVQILGFLIMKSAMGIR